MSVAPRRFEGLDKLIGFRLNDKEWILSVLRGLRNGIICGVRIRTPYVITCATYVVLFHSPETVSRLKFVFKQMFHHGKNLGLFVFIYKTICFILRHYNIRGGIECWIAGFIGGFVAFGESKGISGSVNNQIVLYLFARGLEGVLRSMAKREILPKTFDVKTPLGFRIFAGFSLALILYLTDYESNMLQNGFMATMNNLYYESNYGSLLPPKNYTPFVLIVLISLLSPWLPVLNLDHMLSFVDKIKSPFLPQ